MKYIRNAGFKLQQKIVEFRSYIVDDVDLSIPVLVKYKFRVENVGSTPMVLRHIPYVCCRYTGKKACGLSSEDLEPMMNVA